MCTINIFHNQIHNRVWKPIQVQVELTQLESVTESDFGATITLPVIVGAMGTINIFHNQIHNCVWKLIQVQVELTQSEMCATIIIFVQIYTRTLIDILFQSA
jgi:hypothetical protein